MAVKKGRAGANKMLHERAPRQVFGRKYEREEGQTCGPGGNEGGEDNRPVGRHVAAVPLGTNVRRFYTLSRCRERSAFVGACC